ncbi:hypothetical protein SH661x_002809 [Planctomicrobium sp. SH661]
MARHSAALLITGKVQKAERVIHVIVFRMRDLTERITRIPN